MIYDNNNRENSSLNSQMVKSWNRSPDVYIPSFTSLRSKLMMKSFPEFIRQSWDHVYTQKLIWNWHIDIMCDVLSNIGEPGYPRKVVGNLPPGMSKSGVGNVLFTCWKLARDPREQLVDISYGLDRSTDTNMKARDLILSSWYQEHFGGGGVDGKGGVQISGDQNAKLRFDTTRKGYRIAASSNPDRGGKLTGLHPTGMILDDPMSAQAAQSTTELEKFRNWYDVVMTTRTRNNPWLVCWMQRLAVGDPTDHFLSKGDWYHVCLPMRYRGVKKNEKGEVTYRPYKGDPRKIEGELLAPETHPEEKVQELERDLTVLHAPAQLQQDPQADVGKMFKRVNVQIVDSLPRRLKRCWSWDTADTEGGGNYTAGYECGLGLDDELFYVIRRRKGQWKSSKVDLEIKLQGKLAGKRVAIVEGSGSGKAVVSKRRTDLKGWVYVVAKETESKEERARPLASYWEAGNVRLLVDPYEDEVEERERREKGNGSVQSLGLDVLDVSESLKWNEDFLNIMCGFPGFKFDDDVDSVVNAFNYLTGGLGEKNKERKEIKGSLGW